MEESSRDKGRPKPSAQKRGVEKPGPKPTPQKPGAEKPASRPEAASKPRPSQLRSLRPSRLRSPHFEAHFSPPARRLGNSEMDREHLARRSPLRRSLPGPAKVPGEPVRPRETRRSPYSGRLRTYRPALWSSYTALMLRRRYPTSTPPCTAMPRRSSTSSRSQCSPSQRRPFSRPTCGRTWTSWGRRLSRW